MTGCFPKTKQLFADQSGNGKTTHSPEQACLPWNSILLQFRQVLSREELFILLRTGDHTLFCEEEPVNFDIPDVHRLIRQCLQQIVHSPVGFSKIPNHSKYRGRISAANLRIILVLTEIHANGIFLQDLGRVVTFPAKKF